MKLSTLKDKLDKISLSNVLLLFFTYKGLFNMTTFIECEELIFHEILKIENSEISAEIGWVLSVYRILSVHHFFSQMPRKL